MVREDRNSVLAAGVPRKRGKPVHVEHEDDAAYCVLSGDDVLEIHTPQDTLPRVHEYMHACHSNEKRMRAAYKRVNMTVAQVAEDLRMHLKFWPWRMSRRGTPNVIAKGVQSWLRRERANAKKHLDENPKLKGQWPDFATRLRMAAVMRGLNDGDYLRKAGFGRGKSDTALATTVMNLVYNDKEKQAAEMLHSVFFGALENPPKPPPGPEGEPLGSPDEPGDEEGEDFFHEGDDDERYPDAHAEIIELDHSVRIPEAKIGKRRARMGPRLHRPSLRKPVLPQRLFVKRSPQKPAGTILVDASGSMGHFDLIKNLCERAPFGTIAYYAGSDDATDPYGWLYVYARNGRRAMEIVEPELRGNTVDGPAIDWLLSQKAPRVLITDREFCGAKDSRVQVERLKVLEGQGAIKVENYRRVR